MPSNTHRLTPPIEIKAGNIDNEVQIEIADRGFGIPPGDLLQVFDKFYRIDHPGSVAGTGLGYLSVRELWKLTADISWLKIGRVAGRLSD